MCINDDGVSVSNTGSTNKTTALPFLNNSELYQMDSKTKRLPCFKRVNYQVAENLETGDRQVEMLNMGIFLNPK